VLWKGEQLPFPFKSRQFLNPIGRDQHKMTPPGQIAWRRNVSIRILLPELEVLANDLQFAFRPVLAIPVPKVANHLAKLLNDGAEPLEVESPGGGHFCPVNAEAIAGIGIVVEVGEDLFGIGYFPERRSAPRERARECPQHLGRITTAFPEVEHFPPRPDEVEREGTTGVFFKIAKGQPERFNTFPLKPADDVGGQKGVIDRANAS
jgi:hypothetical protein